MTPTRRLLLIGSLAAVGLAAVPIIRRLSQVSTIIEDAFGPEIAAHPAARAFVRDYQIASIRANMSFLPVPVTRMFLLSTNFLEHYEAGTPLQYDGLYSTEDYPCFNRLSAAYAPPGEFT